MELRTGPGGNQAEIAARLRASLVDVATTVRQIQNEIDRLMARRQTLVEGSARATEAGNESVAARAATALSELEERLADLRDQLAAATQARSEIEAQLKGFPELAVRAEADAHSSAVRQMLAAGGIEDVDQDRADLDALATELRKSSVDAELEAMRRELGLAPPPPAPPTAPTPPTEPTAGPSPTAPADLASATGPATPSAPTVQTGPVNADPDLTVLTAPEPASGQATSAQPQPAQQMPGQPVPGHQAPDLTGPIQQRPAQPGQPRQTQPGAETDPPPPKAGPLEPGAMPDANLPKPPEQPG